MESREGAQELVHFPGARKPHRPEESALDARKGAIVDDFLELTESRRPSSCCSGAGPWPTPLARAVRPGECPLGGPTLFSLGHDADELLKRAKRMVTASHTHFRSATLRAAMASRLFR